jgi:hypothetical protein
MGDLKNLGLDFGGAVTVANGADTADGEHIAEITIGRNGGIGYRSRLSALPRRRAVRS